MVELRTWKVWTYFDEDVTPVLPSYVSCYTKYVVEGGVPFEVQAENGRKAKQIAARLRAEMENGKKKETPKYKSLDRFKTRESIEPYLPKGPPLAALGDLFGALISAEDRVEELEEAINSLFDRCDYVLGEGWRKETLVTSGVTDDLNAAWVRLAKAVGQKAKS